MKSSDEVVKSYSALLAVNPRPLSSPKNADAIELDLDIVRIFESEG